MSSRIIRVAMLVNNFRGIPQLVVLVFVRGTGIRSIVMETFCFILLQERSNHLPHLHVIHYAVIR